MTHKTFTTKDGQDIAYTQTGAGAPVFVWAHGWGQSGAALQALAGGAAQILGGTHICVDFPGFGASPAPQSVRGTEDYADEVAEFLYTLDAPVIWIGHSFGCRVGMQLAVRHPQLARAMLLIAAAGLPRKRLWPEQIKVKTKIFIYKALKKLVPPNFFVAHLLSKFGSADYKTAGPLRESFVRVVNEDLSDLAQRITIPVRLVYGKDDAHTPPHDIGRRLENLIPGTTLKIIPGLNHFSVLDKGRHQVLTELKALAKDQT